MSDEDLAKFLGLHGDPRWPGVIANLTPEKRAMYERMAWVTDELNAGRVPDGVMVCR
jgi:hypothetical protein